MTEKHEQENNIVKILGLTGGIASGKSEVSKILSRHGGHILDADEINHVNMLKQGRAYNEIINFFGRDVLNGSMEIDRTKLGIIVFNDREKLNELVGITHKYVKQAAYEEISRIRAGNTSGFIVIDAPLLIEAHMHTVCDETWLVYCDTEERIRRLSKRNGYSRDEALKRINAQTPLEVLKQNVDVIINNTGGMDELRAIVEENLDRFLRLHE